MQQIMPLPQSLPSPAPACTYAYTTTEELIAMFPSRIEEKQSSKCLVYTLTGFVTLFAVWFVFASIVLRVGDPEIQLRSARLMHNTHNHNVSLSSPFNVTMIASVTLTNPNFGRFYYGNSTVSVLYGASSVGAWELEGARVGARDTKEINFMVLMRFNKLLVKGNLTNDIRSGMLKLRSYAKLSGTVHVLKMVKKRKTIEMACIMNLNLTSHSIHHLQC
ncbi:Late embryogenesis abundant protein [Spatholobus suberectus]|nr:Late embryogenesis abundant protein [Spatholobus suberectus]